MNIFTLMGTIFIDTDKANESISKTDEKAQGLAGKLGEGIKTAGKWAAGIGAAAGVVGGAMLGVASKTADAMGAIDDSAQKAGVSAEEFQKYSYAAKLSGMETATLEGAMIKAQKSFADASEGSKTASEAFSRLGLDVSSMTSDGAFDAAIMALADIEDTTERNAIANDIFGKSYAELAPMLNGGSEGIKALKDEAVKLGGVMSNEAVSAGAEFGDAIDKAKTMANGLFMELGTSLIPIFMQLLTWVTDHMPEIQSFVGTAFEVISNVVSVAYDWFSKYLLPIFDTIFTWVGENWPAIQKVFETVFGVIFDLVSTVWTLFKDGLLPILSALWEFIEPTFPLIQGIVEVTFGAIVKTVETVVDIFKAVSDAIAEAIDWLTFWNDTDAEDKDVGTSSSGNKKKNGSHASGLAYVPFDGYIAEVHEGEGILTKDENKKYRNSESSGGDVIITGNSFVVREESDIKKIARELHRLQRTKERGTVPA
ncbi:MAG: tail tape measure protein core region [Sedimentibacter sp.]|jgi:hypothetical protein|nr:tail tape measure protein core region [Sedimentibacter sp.]